MELKITEDTLRENAEKKQDDLYALYKSLYNKVKFNRFLYLEQLRGIDLCLSNLKKDINRTRRTFFVTLIISIVLHQYILTADSVSSIAPRLVGSVTLTICIISAFLYLKNQFKNAVLLEKQPFIRYINKRGLVTAEVERRHCQKEISNINISLDKRIQKDNVTNDDINELTALSWYKEIRKSENVLPLRESGPVSLFVIAVIYIACYILI